MASVAFTPSGVVEEPVLMPLDLVRESTECLQEKLESGDYLALPSHCQFDDLTDDLDRASTEVLQEQLERQQQQAIYPSYHAGTMCQFPGCGLQFPTPMYDVIAMPFISSQQPCMEPIPGLPWSEHAEALALQQLQQYHNMAMYAPDQPFVATPADAATSEPAAAIVAEPESLPVGVADGSEIASCNIGPRFLAPQVPQTLQTEVLVVDEKKVLRAILTVPGSKLDSRARMVISQQLFYIPSREGKVPCKIKVSAKEMHTQKHGQCFKTSNGVGKVEIKCEDLFPEDAPPITFTIAVGRDKNAQGTRGPVAHNFSQASVAGLPDGEADWDFKAAVDVSTRSFDIMVDIQLPEC